MISAPKPMIENPRPPQGIVLLFSSFTYKNFNLMFFCHFQTKENNRVIYSHEPQRYSSCGTDALDEEHCVWMSKRRELFGV